MVYVYKVPLPLLEKLYEIKELADIPIAKQIKTGIEEYVFKFERSKSPFMKSLGRYERPKVGEKLKTEHGDAEIVDIKFYDDVVKEIEYGGFSSEEIEQFTSRVEHFLGNKNKYFECEINYEDGETETIDWSKYLALKNKKGG